MNPNNIYIEHSFIEGDLRTFNRFAAIFHKGMCDFLAKHGLYPEVVYLGAQEMEAMRDLGRPLMPCLPATDQSSEDRFMGIPYFQVIDNNKHMRFVGDQNL